MAWLWIAALFAVLLVYHLVIYLRNTDPALKKTLLIRLVANLVAVVASGIVAAFGS